jgi:16S rRNA (guanine966-N2)-methyltransferase
MRIISGTHRGTHLAPVGAGDPKSHLRPTSDRVREAIFNLLVNGGYGNPIASARVLDLFAGTGALGLEALSRGATHATFVDDGAPARALLRRNIDILRRAADTAIIRADATHLPPCTTPFTLAFLDPPYARAKGEAALASALAQGWLAPDALIVWEESAPPIPPAGFDRLDQRIYGDTIVTILRAPA